jgi:DNA-binding response OmpR family regulator
MNIAATILVVDDEPNLVEYIRQTLDRAGYQVLAAGDGLQALEVLETHSVDLILTDIAMPRMNGYQLHERVIENPSWVTIPFLFLSALADDSNIRYGKELGVDDYLTKPFDMQDLLAAVRGKLRRAQQLTRLSSEHTQQPNGGSETLALGRLRIDRCQHRVWLNGRPIKLSAREFRLLECLAQRAEEVITLRELIQITHELNTNHAEASVLLRPLVRSLRRKLGYPTGELGCIESVRGVGYQLIPPAD